MLNGREDVISVSFSDVGWGGNIEDFGSANRFLSEDEGGE